MSMGVRSSNLLLCLKAVNLIKCVTRWRVVSVRHRVTSWVVIGLVSSMSFSNCQQNTLLGAIILWVFGPNTSLKTSGWCMLSISSRRPPWPSIHSRRNALWIVCGSGIVGVSVNAGSRFSNAPKRSWPCHLQQHDNDRGRNLCYDPVSYQETIGLVE